MLDIQKATEGVRRAENDLRAKARAVQELTLKLQQIQADARQAETREDLRAAVALLAQAEETARTLVYAHADWEKQKGVAGVVRTTAEMVARAERATASGDRATALRWRTAAEKLSTEALTKLSTQKVKVKLPPRTKVGKRLAAVGTPQQLAGLDDLAFFKSVGRAFNRGVQSVQKRVQTVTKAIGRTAANVGKFVAANGPAVLGTVGAVVGSVVPGVGTALGASLGTAVGGLLKAATAKSAAQAPVPPPEVATVVPPTPPGGPPELYDPNALPQGYSGAPASAALPPVPSQGLIQRMKGGSASPAPGTDYRIPEQAFAPPRAGGVPKVAIALGAGAVGLLGVVVALKKRRG